MPGSSPPAPGPYLQTVSGRWVNPFDPDPAQLEGVEPLDIELEAWPPDEAARAFGERYAELDARRR